MEKLVSIIVPVHNSSKYLNACIDGILNQTYRNVEIIAVENGSVDESLNILKSYGNKIRLEVLTKSGLSLARNKGIEISKGEYVAFVDSDDVIEPDMIEELVKNLESNKSDLSICNFKEIYEDSGKIVERNEYPKSKIFKNEVESNLIKFNFAIWNKLYKREIIIKNDIKFPIDLKYEDIPFVLNYLLKTNSVSKVDRILYNYLIHSKSEQTTVNERVFDILKIMELCLEIVPEEMLESVYIREVITYALKMRYVKNKTLRVSFINNAYLELNKRYPNWKKSNYIKEFPFIKKVLVQSSRLVKLYTSVYVMLYY